MTKKSILKDEEIQAGYSREDAYFYQADQELKEKRRRDLEDRRKARDFSATQPYWMKCPKCGCCLDELDIGGITANQCSSCSGLYFEKPELETLVHSGDASSFLTHLKAILQSTD